LGVAVQSLNLETDDMNEGDFTYYAVKIVDSNSAVSTPIAAATSESSDERAAQDKESLSSFDPLGVQAPEPNVVWWGESDDDDIEMHSNPPDSGSDGESESM
jgi:hypothetical protein